MYKKVNPKSTLDIDLDELEEPELDETLIEEPEIEEPEIEEPEIEEPIVEKPKRRGRPPKKKEPEQQTVPEKPKRRGRPPKNKQPEVENINPDDSYSNNNNVLPGFDDDDDDEVQNNNYLNNNNVLPGFDDDDDDEDNYSNNNNVLPGFDDDDDEDEESNNNYSNNSNVLPGFDDDDEDEEPNNNYSNNNNQLPGFNDDDDDEDENVSNNVAQKQMMQDEFEEEYTVKTNPNNNRPVMPPYVEKANNNNDMGITNNGFDDEELDNLLLSDKKLISFVGTSKNGTSFVINTVAQMLSSMGVDTAIYDATQNKNSYYIYTKNDEQLRQIAANSIENLIKGNANGIKVNNNLTVYTNVPNQNDKMQQALPIMETLLKNHTVILVDCDFDTPLEYFEKSQEMYLVQSMDVLTIQPLTAFLRELKVKNILNPNKLRIVLNKLLRIRGVTSKSIVGGMSYYNDPEMSFMTELFDRNIARVVAHIPFDEDVYVKYLEDLIECEIKINNYPKDFRQNIKNLAGVIYPLLPSNNGYNKKTKEKKKASQMPQYSSSFSSSMNNTLNDMKKKF